MKDQYGIVLSFDTDWCPDSMIEPILQKLRQFNIKSTWFVTNDSPLIQSMKEDPLVELGIHPNFLPDSTQGKTYDEILCNLIKIVPDAVSVRNHTLYWSSGLLDRFERFGIKYDSSLSLQSSKNIKPYKNKSTNLLRFPIYWEDDIALMENNINIDLAVSGLKILNFHPVHILLNSYSIANYSMAKRNQNWNDYINNGNIEGIRNVFEKLVLSLKNKKLYTLKELGESYN